MKRYILSYILLFSAVFAFNTKSAAEAVVPRVPDSKCPWLKHGSIYYERLDATEMPIYFYRDSRGNPYLLSGSLVGLEVILQNEFCDRAPHEELPSLIGSLYRMPFSSVISESLLIDYKKMIVEIELNKAEFESRNPNVTVRTDSRLEQLSAALTGLYEYIRKTGCFASDKGWTIQYYVLRQSGGIFSFRFYFSRDWTLDSLEMSKVETIPELDHGIFY